MKSNAFQANLPVILLVKSTENENGALAGLQHDPDDVKSIEINKCGV